jgi:hypothetical protein
MTHLFRGVIPALFLLGASAFAQNRTYMDTDLGKVFTTVSDVTNADWGFYLQVSSNYIGNQLPARTVKVDWSRFECFPQDETAFPLFPYSKFKAYEASEVAAGRAPLFLTATYQGKKRPLLFSWDLHLVNNKPTSDPKIWCYGVNVGDPRFVQFWVNEYIRSSFFPKVNTTPNVWIGLDATAVRADLFGVLDDSGSFVNNVVWDQPFPQSETAWMTAAKAFLDSVPQLAPDIRTIPNHGSIYDPTQFPSIFANVPGLVNENFWPGSAPVAYTRNQSQQQFAAYAAWGAQGKVATLREWVTKGNTSDLLSAYVLFELVKGPNFFFTPTYNGGLTGASPTLYHPWGDLLGNPTAAYTSAPQAGMRSGYNFYSRTYDGGIVYLNWAGVAKTVALPVGGVYYDPKGNRVTSVSLPDGYGTFVTTAKSRVAAPQIAPRYDRLVAGPVSVTISSKVANSVTHYTLDGTTPTAGSPVYSGPIRVSASGSVKAISALSGSTNSAVSTADYSVVSQLPSVEFKASSDSGPAGTAFPLLCLSALSSSTVTVGYTVQSPNGSTSITSTTILTGDSYKAVRVPISGVSGQQYHLVLTSATNASVGPNASFDYTIQ